MSLANFSLPYQLATPSPYVFTGSHGPQSTISNLRLNAVLPPPPAPSFNDEHGYQNVPYIPPARYQQQHQQQQQRQREQQLRAQESYSGQQQQQQQQQQQHGIAVSSSFSSANQDTRYANYNQDFRRTQPRQQQIPQQHIPPQSQHQQLPRPAPAIPQHHQQHQHHQQQQQQQQLPRVPVRQEQDHVPQNGQQNGPQNGSPGDEDAENYPGRPGDGYTRVNGGTYGSPGAKTSVHAILDYDDDEEDNPDDYYDDGDSDVPKDTRVTPIQGPIFLKNGSVPVVPLYSYPQLNNGTFVQIPILWTALSVALGVELRGDLVRGTPCIKRYHQLFCPTAGKTYPIERIEQFIDENKALMKRMYGDFEMDEDYGSPTREPGTRRRRNTKKHDLPDGGPSLPDENRRKRREPDPRVVEGGESFFSKVRNARQTLSNSRGNESGRVDACESKVEIVTPYWASNSAGKVRAIVNTQHFEQAIHQEVCSKTKTNRCTSDCGCEQKYKWHRLLAYDPDNDCKGIFMDWFLFPSCCVCRCDPPNRKFPTTTSRN